MFSSVYKSQLIDGQKEKFVRLEESPRVSFVSGVDHHRVSAGGLQMEMFQRRPAAGMVTAPSKSLRRGMLKGSERLKSIGRTLRTGVSKAVFQEDLKKSEKKILDPQDRQLIRMNRLLVMSCLVAIAVDPLFLYLPFFDHVRSTCIAIDRHLAVVCTTIRTAVDSFYLLRMALQFRTAYIAPSSRVFGRGELVIDPAQIASRYLRRYFAVDFLAVLPIPQSIIWSYLRTPGSALGVRNTKRALIVTVFLQYVPRFVRVVPLQAELKRTAGVFAETAWEGAAYYLLWFLLAAHIMGAFWYQLAVGRMEDCWKGVCNETTAVSGCTEQFLFCGDEGTPELDRWNNVSDGLLYYYCGTKNYSFGIYELAVSSNVLFTRHFISKLFFCLWWGLQNLSTLGQGLMTSIYTGEVIFSIVLAISGLILFAMLIGNMQAYLQSLTLRLEEMRVKRRDSEQWMHHRLLPQELRERVRRYDQYKWVETRGVDEESLVQGLPKDLRREIKRHLCLGLVRRVPLFENMDERLLDAICERLQPSLCTEMTYIVREGDPVGEMLFIIRGRLESVTTDGGRSGFYNRGVLSGGDFCGEELLTWALDPKAGGSLPSSTRTVRALTEVEAFALRAEELKFVAGQFRRLHSKQVQHTFRFYSQQWRTWAACFIQAAWRRHAKRKVAEQQRRAAEAGAGGKSLGTTILVSRFKANALRGLHKSRSRGIQDIVVLPKPPEPDFNDND